MKIHNHGIYTSDGLPLNPNGECSKRRILDIFDDALFLTYHNFIETRFNKVYINVNISNGYKVFHQPKMSIIPNRSAADRPETKRSGTGISVPDLFAPRNSEILNLWKGFVELVHYIDENQEWLERELEVCKKLKY